MTTSHASASDRGLVPAVAPAATSGAMASALRSSTVMSKPLRSRLAASLPPTLPRPMNPTRMRLLLVLLGGNVTPGLASGE